MSGDSGRTTEQRLPTFLLIGAMKAGTTSLYHYLQAHPQVATPRYKAPEFFVAEATGIAASTGTDGSSHPSRPEVLAVGEASNVY